VADEDYPVSVAVSEGNHPTSSTRHLRLPEDELNYPFLDGIIRKAQSVSLDDVFVRTCQSWQEAVCDAYLTCQRSRVI